MTSNEKTKIILASIVSSLVTLLVVAILFGIGRPDSLSKTARFNTLNIDPATAQEALVISAVAEARPAVVSIVVTKDVPKYEPYYRDFFGFPFQIPDLRQNGTQRQEIGGGSGFFVSDDGYIVTNRHVVEDSEADYTVFTNEGVQYPARVIARDEILDIAILRVEDKDLPYLSLGDSDQLVVGQTAIAIGNALGEFSNTVSVGIVSGLSRSIVAGGSFGRSENLEQVIQTDAAINPGNSGGPLLDIRGKVIGVNVAVASGSENIGFALPVNAVKSVVDSVRKTGRIVRPYLGVRYITVTEDMQEEMNLPVSYGVLLAPGAQGEPAVVPGSPALKADLREGDVIVSVDGDELKEKSLTHVLRGKEVGEAVEISFYRKGTMRTVTVVLGSAN